MIFSLANNVLSGVSSFFQRREARKQDERDKRAELLRAGIEERSNGIKDEIALIVILAPFVACFVPGFEPYVRAGFETLKNSTPEWYQDLFFWGVAGALGITQILKPLRR